MSSIKNFHHLGRVAGLMGVEGNERKQKRVDWENIKLSLIHIYFFVCVVEAAFDDNIRKVMMPLCSICSLKSNLSLVERNATPRQECVCNRVIRYLHLHKTN